MFTTLLSFVLSKMLLFALHIESRTLPKPLTRKEEKEEFEKYHSGDMSARDRLIKHNLRLNTLFLGKVAKLLCLSIGYGKRLFTVNVLSCQNRVYDSVLFLGVSRYGIGIYASGARYGNCEKGA